MQCKDIPNKPILEFLDKMDGVWTNWFEEADWNTNSIRQAFPKDTIGKLVLAKMRQLIKRHLVDGCGCGCRGDFVITDKGKQWLIDN